MPDHHSAYGGEFNSRRGKRRFNDDEPTTAKRARRRALPSLEVLDATDGLPDGDRWSTWDQSTPTGRGPKPTRAGWSPSTPRSTPSSGS